MQLSFSLLSVKRLGKRVCSSEPEVVVLLPNKVACCVQLSGEQLCQVEALEYLGVIAVYECQRNQGTNRCCCICNVDATPQSSVREGANQGHNLLV